MEIASIFIGLVLLVAAMGFVMLPFQGKKQNASKQALEAQPQARRETVLSALRDLDFDFKTGKVSEEDYSPLRGQLLAEAAQLTQQEQEKEDQLEALIQSRRNHQQELRCAECGAPIIGGQHFCSKCGSPVETRNCPGCGNKIKPGDMFCPGCGSRLEMRVEAAGPA